MEGELRGGGAVNVRNWLRSQELVVMALNGEKRDVQNGGGRGGPRPGENCIIVEPNVRILFDSSNSSLFTVSAQDEAIMMRRMRKQSQNR